jgi:hypothetical protein
MRIAETPEQVRRAAEDRRVADVHKYLSELYRIVREYWQRERARFRGQALRKGLGKPKVAELDRLFEAPSVDSFLDGFEQLFVNPSIAYPEQERRAQCREAAARHAMLMAEGTRAGVPESKITKCEKEFRRRYCKCMQESVGKQVKRGGRQTHPRTLLIRAIAARSGGWQAITESAEARRHVYALGQQNRPDLFPLPPSRKMERARVVADALGKTSPESRTHAEILAAVHRRRRYAASSTES